MHEQTTNGLTRQEQAALAALRTRSDWTGHYGQPQLMTLPHTQYGWLFAEVSLDRSRAYWERINAANVGLTLAEYQFAAIIEDSSFELGA